ncbi:MAG: RNA polymerase sigma factor [Planctomycetaceae bacterium]
MHEAFLHDGYGRLVGAVALASGSFATAEDAVQEAVIRAWERLDRGDRIERLDAWIATVALNLSRSGFRRLVAERRAKARLTVPLETAAPDGDEIDVRRALAMLAPRQREAAVLRYLLELSTAEIADVMRTSEGTVKSQLAKARAHLVETLALHDEEPQEEPNHAHR